MKSKKERSFIQCLNCGHIHTVEWTIPISVSVVTIECPKCEWEKGLNCGNKEEDLYVYYDPYLDERYFIY